MTLLETVTLMTSTDYKERFEAEYNQLALRYHGLKKMLEKWDSGTLDFTPTCPREIYNDQMTHMANYMTVLERRADLEEVELNCDF